MAITDTQKVDYLLKKIGYGVAKTDTSAVKSPANESISSPLLVRGDTVWGQSDLIPTTAPASNTSVVTTYTGTHAVQTVNDGTASTNRTWKTNLTGWIGSEFGATYQPRVYAAPSGAANAAATGTRLYPDGSGSSDSWFFDYQSGVLNFADTNVPSAVTGNVIYIEGYRYTGSIGISNTAANTGNITFSGSTIGTSTSNGNITVNPDGTGTIVLDATTVVNGSLTATTVSSNTTINGNALTVQTGTFTSNIVAQTITSNTDINSVSVTANTGSFSNSISVANALTSNATVTAVNSNTASTSYTTGAFVVAGGVGISGNLNVQGAVSTSNLIVNGGDLTNVNIGNITFSNTTVTTKLVNGNITLTPTGTGLVYIDSVLALRLPSGNVAQQPSNPPIGAIRYNTEYESPEFWNGLDWVPTTTTIDSEVINPDGFNNIFTLSRVTNTTGIFVSINGVVQVPGTAYAVSGNQITFTEIPQTTDVVDVRYMSAGSVVPLHEEQSFLVRTVGFNAAPNTRYAVDTSAASITVLLPAIPFTGDAIYFADAGGAYSTHNLVIDPNGETISGSTSPLVINTDGDSFGLLWNGTTWKRY